jgi:hypothetical protein
MTREQSSPSACRTKQAAEYAYNTGLDGDESTAAAPAYADGDEAVVICCGVAGRSIAYAPSIEKIALNQSTYH